MAGLHRSLQEWFQCTQRLEGGARQEPSTTHRSADPTMYRLPRKVGSQQGQLPPSSVAPSIHQENQQARLYMPAAFPRWVEAGGARVVPIRFDASDAELKRLFNSINGLLFPGGLTWLWLDAPYVITARKLFTWAVEANMAGDVFPIHGTCLGFQLLHILASNLSRNNLLVPTNSVTHATTVQFQGGAADTSNMYKGLSAHLKQAMQSTEHKIVLQNHENGMLPSMYQRYPDLGVWYRILSTSVDRNGTQYISDIEGTAFPFTGTQWHPEKPPFEFGMLEVPHSLEAVQLSQHLANVFVDTARRSSHKPRSTEEELTMLIYDTPPVFSQRFEVMAEDNYDGPDITYYFDRPHRPSFYRFITPGADGPGNVATLEAGVHLVLFLVMVVSVLCFLIVPLLRWLRARELWHQKLHAKMLQ